MNLHAVALANKCWDVLKERVMQQRYSRWIGAFGRLSTTLPAQAGRALPLCAALALGGVITPAAHAGNTVNERVEQQAAVDRIIVKWRDDSLAAVTSDSKRADRLSLQSKRTFKHQRIASNG